MLYIHSYSECTFFHVHDDWEQWDNDDSRVMMKEIKTEELRERTFSFLELFSMIERKKFRYGAEM